MLPLILPKSLSLPTPSATVASTVVLVSSGITTGTGARDGGGEGVVTVDPT